jgi:hypothetical protein
MTPHQPPGREGDDRYVRGQEEPRNNQEDEVLEFDGLNKNFGEIHVLDGVSFPVAPGSSSRSSASASSTGC